MREMEIKDGSYEEYAQVAIKLHYEKDERERNLLVDSIKDKEIRRVLDIGCGAGQDMLPFIEKKDAFCVGIDVGEELGRIGNSLADKTGFRERIVFTRSMGEDLPFADESFDVVLCRIAITLMNNQKAIAEVSRILRPGGVFLLKTHSPQFYFGMIKRRFSSLSPRQLAYPIISLAGGTFQLVTGKYPAIEFWKGREVFQTKGTLERELRKHSMEIRRLMPDSNSEAPSYYIVKN
ncbi:MAG: class I SAM-dependent methyltransferase [Pyrinomonadaceae bacterium]|nr:class I SAM-dependent methyltransferase [Pyrinomonadaceae bacterium]